MVTHPQSPPGARPLTTTQVAEALGVSRRTVQQMILAGELPAYRIGAGRRPRQYRITPHAVEAYRQRQAVPR